MTNPSDTTMQRMHARYAFAGPTPTARLDLPLLLPISVTNTGAATWPNRGPNPVNIAYHWLDANGQVVDFEGLRTPLPGAVPPGETIELEVQIEPPPHPGDYQLAIDLVEEGIDWFMIQGVEPLKIPLTVAPPDELPRACIINGNCMVNDAVGNHVVNQLRFFQNRGYRTLTLVEHIDPRQPASLRQNILPITLDELRDGPSIGPTRRAVHHFRSADIYIFNYSTYYTLVDAIRLVGNGIVVFDYHGVTPPHLWDGPGVEHLIEGQRNLELVRYADYAIGHSGFTRQELLNTGLIAPERVYQMPYVVPLERFRPGPRAPELLERYGLTDDQPVLLYVGRMATNKRIDVLVRALIEIREHIPNAVLMLVGDNRSQAYARATSQARDIAAASGIADGLIFTGQIPDSELAAHYQLASVFVTASLHEGFCIPVLEAMSCGTPVVGAHATALPETIGAAGLTFEPGNARDLAHKILAVLGHMTLESTEQA